MLVTKESLTADDGTVVPFLRVVVGVTVATVLRAQWTTAPKGVAWKSFGALSWSLPAEVIAELRSVLALPADVRVGVNTPATEAEVTDFHASSADHPGERFGRRGEVTLTFGCDADGNVRVQNGWANAKLVLTGEEAGWTPVASAAATTASTVALARR